MTASGSNKLFVGQKIANRYCITGQIGKGGMGIVYKAIPFDDPSHSVAIKVIQRSGKLGYDDLMRFQKEASLMSQLHHPNIVVFHELGLFGRSKEEQETIGSGYYIVMEIADGTNLKESLARDGRKDLAFFFQVGLQVSAALDYTHGKNIIHRDIKPHNIIVGQAFRDQRGVLVKVLDFGVARLAEAINYGGGRDSGNTKGFEEAAGTPLYMAPEQTPLMMDAPVDHRVDLYSLGCVLYEILAGEPPFVDSTREKLEKKHVFAEPERLTNRRPDLPPLVEKIVHKLLAKHPNDRYQTAFSLHADLLRAKSLFEKSGRPSAISFPLGLKDRFQAVSAQLALIGRDAEHDTLIHEYDNVSTARGRSRLTLVTGPAGIGKSRLMEEFKAYLARRKVRFVSGQFSQHENALPFNALANAFNEYLHRVLKSYPHEAEELRRRVRTTLGPTAHRIADVVPGLKPFLADIPEEAEDGDENSQQDVQKNHDAFATFAKAFSDFTKCLGTDNQPVVFLFHDLHWADDKSLDLIDTFFTNANALRFYLVVSQRTGLHVRNQRFEQFIEKFSKLKRRYTEINLTQIDRASVTRIVGNMLSDEASVTTELVDYLEEQSKGNPMHLVELTRVLVARDYIHPNAVGERWDFDIKVLKKTQIQLNTVDLILSRIQEFQEFDRQVLQIAATIGLTFQFEMLLLGGRSQSVPVMRSIQKAMDEGLVVRVTDDADLRHLGKTYMFAHKKARDAIYEAIDPDRRRVLHKMIGEKLESAIPEPSEKILFALSHHFNSALTDGTTEDKALAERSLKYNRKAGQAAYQSGSYETAERYYENAWKIMDTWKDAIASTEDRAFVLETLADLAAMQRGNKRALDTYRQLLRQPLPRATHAVIAHKAIQIQMVAGIITDTIKMITSALQVMRRPEVKHNIFSMAGVCWSVFLDILPVHFSGKRMFKVLKGVTAVNRKDYAALERKYPVARIYLSGFQLFLHEKRNLALVYHNMAFREALKGQATPSTVIRLVAERAAMLGVLGFFEVSYRFLDLAMEVARSSRLPVLYGYVSLLRAMTVDYVKGRQDEMSDHLKEAINYLKPTEDRLAYTHAMLFQIYRELLRCNFTAMYNLCQRIPDTIQTRNWLSPRAVAMKLFGYLLQDARTNIVQQGEGFLKRRRKVAGRQNDIFVKVVNTLVFFARGETDKTREAFQQVVNDYTTRWQAYFLFPFEEDFIGLFTMTFPLIYEQEYGRHLMRTQEMEVILQQLKKRLTRMGGKRRMIPALLIARASEMQGNDKGIRAVYDQTMRQAKVAGNQLLMVFVYLWFGSHLIDRGQPQKRDYIRRALLLAHKLELRALVEYTKKLMEKKDIYLKEAQLITATTSRGQAEHTGKVPSRLFMEHLTHACDEIESENSLEDAIRESFAILAKHYNAGRIFCIMSTREGELKVVYPLDAGTDSKQIIEYIEPYFNIRSTLFLPLNDAPWIKGERGDAPAGAAGGRGMVLATDSPSVDDDFNAESTMVMGGAAPTVPSDGATAGPASGGDQSMFRNATHLGEGNMAGQILQMSALVPMRSGSQSLGVVFIEDIGNQQNRDTTACRGELDQFGSQLALMIERKSGLDLSSGTLQVMQTANAIYQPASYTLEPVSWLKVWHHGRLRAQRETAWFLGLNFGPDTYVLAYCLLTGTEPVRERFGSMIWHHLYVIRALALASGRSYQDVAELRDEFSGLFAATPKASQLESISLAVSVFSRSRRNVVSGHFGPSRPFVVGVENLVQPSNNIVLTYANGRDLRYWDVNADLSQPHAYVLSYDTSKLDTAPVETAQKRAPLLFQSEGVEELHRALAGVVAESNLPRYYVAALMRQDEEEGRISELDHYDKAE